MSIDLALTAGTFPAKDAGLLLSKAWPRFLSEPSDIPDPTTRVRMTIEESKRRNFTWELRRPSDGKIAFAAYALLIYADLAALPPGGWRYAVEAVARSSPEPNCLCLVSMTVDEEFRGLRLPALMLEEVKEKARELGLASVIVAVRPTRMHEFPGISMEDYITKCDEKGAPFDPWLRTHMASGGRIRGVCPESVIVRATVSHWRKWTGEKFEGEGEHWVQHGLAPVVVKDGIGTYTEPNVWVEYSL